MGFAKLIPLEGFKGSSNASTWDPKEDCPLTLILPFYLMCFDLPCLAFLDSHTKCENGWDNGPHQPWKEVTWGGCVAGLGPVCWRGWCRGQSGITLSCRRNISLQKKRSEPGSISLNINYSDAFCHASSESSGHSQTLPHRSSSQRYWVRSRQ